MIVINREFAKEWIQALRSGQYEQGVEYLRNEDNQFCCLGVACDLLMGTSVNPGSWVDSADHPNGLAYALDFEEAWYDQYLPPDVAYHLGLTTDGAFRDEDGELVEFTVRSMPNVHFQNLALANDSGATFEDIAALLEDIVEGRFGA